MAFLVILMPVHLSASVVDGTSTPWNVIGKLRVSGVQSCSAALVGSHLVLTAAHCIYDRKKKMYFPPQQIHFMAGLQGKKLVAQSQARSYTVATERLPEGEFNEQALLTDWALIELTYPVGCMLGYFDTESPETAQTSKLLAAGYPQSDSSQMHVEDHCEYALDPDDEKMLRLKSCAVEHGDSGGPILALHGNKARVVGVLSAGVNDSKGRYRAFAVPSTKFAKSISKLSKSCSEFRPMFP